MGPEQTMKDFLNYFLHHMPSGEQWMSFLLINIVAFLAARNTVLRRERRDEEKEYAERVGRMKSERVLYVDSNDRQAQTIDEQWAMIQKQSKQINELTVQLNSAKTLHLN